MAKHIGSVLLFVMLFSHFAYVRAQSNTTIITPANAENLTLMAEITFVSVDEGMLSDREIVWSSNNTHIAFAAGRQVWVYNLASSSRDHFISPPMEQERADCAHDVNLIRDLAFHPTQPLIAFATLHDIQVWNYQTNIEVSRIETWTQEIEFISNGNLIFVEGEAYMTWNLQDAPEVALRTTSGAIQEFAVSLDETLVASSAYLSNVDVQNLQTASTVQLLVPKTCDGGGGGGCATLPDDEIITFGGGDTFITGGSAPSCGEDELVVYSTSTGDERFSMNKGEGSVSSSPIENILAIPDSENNNIEIHSSINGELLATLPHTNVNSMAFSMDGTRFATISNNKARIWALPEDLPTREEAAAYSSVIFDAACDNNVTSFTSWQTVSMGWSWYAQTEEQLHDHIFNANYDIYMFEDTIPERWVFLTQPERVAAYNNDWTVYYYMPLGTQYAGTIPYTMDVSWNERITDGYNEYGPNTDNPSYHTSCVLTIR